MKTLNVNAFLGKIRALKQRAIYGYVMLTAVLIAPHSVFANANVGLGDVGNNIAEQGTGLRNGLLVVSGLGGLYLVISGIMEWRKASRNRESTGGPFISIIAGALLLAPLAIVGIMQISTIGTDQSGQQLQMLQ